MALMETTRQEFETLGLKESPLHILDLPYDLVHVVFLLCWDQEDERLRHFPIVASHVCRLWRQYALENPNFWASLTFQTPFPEIDKYTIWLARSKDVPFDLHVGWQPFQRSSIKHAKEIMRLIIPHTQRMRSIWVERVPSKIRRLIFDRLDKVNCMSLVTLRVEKELYMFSTLDQAPWRFRPFAKGGAPRLKEVILQRIPNDYFIHQFKDLHLLDIADRTLFTTSARHNAETVQKILSVLSKLQTLRINREVITTGDATPEPTDMRLFQSTLPPIIHHSLRELSLLATQRDANAIVSSLILPSLRHLRRDVDYGLAIGARCLAMLAQPVLHHPFPNLLNLRLAGGHNPDNPVDPVHYSQLAFLERALASLPRLEVLNLEQLDFENNKHIACMARSCPRLKELVFFCCSGLTLVELRSVLRRRGEASDLDPLRYVCVEDPWSYRIQRLVEQAKEQEGEGSVEFYTEILKGMAGRIVLVGKEYMVA